jgi:hypothetical protein
MKYIRVFGAVLALSSISSAANAETDARDYDALAYAKNNSLVTLGYARAISTSDSQNLAQTLGLFRAAYVLKFGNLAVVPFDAFQPVADVTVYNTPTPPMAGAMGMPAAPSVFHISSVLDHVSGMADMTYLPTIAYIIPEGEGAHALDTHTFVAATVYFTLPTGMYDSTKLINIGKHRFSIQPQIAIGQRISQNFTIEAIGYAVFYTDNTAFQPPAMLPLQTLKQSPTYGADAHFAANLSPTGYVSASYYIAANGRTFFDPTVGGQQVAVEATTVDQQTIQTLRFSYGWRVEKDSLILFQFNQDIEASGTGATISRFLGARVSHVFDF